MFAEFMFEGRGIVMSNTSPIFGHNTPISYNGYHIGIEYKGNIHCNVHPQGLPTDMWFRDFESAFGMRQARFVGRNPRTAIHPAWPW